MVIINNIIINFTKVIHNKYDFCGLAMLSGGLEVLGSREVGQNYLRTFC